MPVDLNYIVNKLIDVHSSHGELMIQVVLGYEEIKRNEEFKDIEEMKIIVPY